MRSFIICTLRKYYSDGTGEMNENMLKTVAKLGEKTPIRTRCRWEASIFLYLFVTYLMMLSVLRL
jgi:hypothetical protein